MTIIRGDNKKNETMKELIDSQLRVDNGRLQSNLMKHEVNFVNKDNEL